MAEDRRSCNSSECSTKTSPSYVCSCFSAGTSSSLCDPSHCSLNGNTKPVDKDEINSCNNNHGAGNSPDTDSSEVNSNQEDENVDDSSFDKVSHSNESHVSDLSYIESRSPKCLPQHRGKASSESDFSSNEDGDSKFIYQRMREILKDGRERIKNEMGKTFYHRIIPERRDNNFTPYSKAETERFVHHEDDDKFDSEGRIKINLQDGCDFQRFVMEDLPDLSSDDDFEKSEVYKQWSAELDAKQAEVEQNNALKRTRSNPNEIFISRKKHIKEDISSLDDEELRDQFNTSIKEGRFESYKLSPKKDKNRKNKRKQLSSSVKLDSEEKENTYDRHIQLDKTPTQCQISETNQLGLSAGSLLCTEEYFLQEEENIHEQVQIKPLKQPIQHEMTKREQLNASGKSTLSIMEKSVHDVAQHQMTEKEKLSPSVKSALPINEKKSTEDEQPLKKPVQDQITRKEHLSPSVKSTLFITEKSMHDEQPVKKHVEYQRSKRRHLTSSRNSVLPTEDRKKLHHKQQVKTPVQPVKRSIRQQITKMKQLKSVKSILSPKGLRSTHKSEIRPVKIPVQYQISKRKQLKVPLSKQMNSTAKSKLPIKRKNACDDEQDRKLAQHQVTKRKKLSSSVKAVLSPKGKNKTCNQKFQAVKKPVRRQISKNKQLSSSVKSMSSKIEKKSAHDKQPVKKPLQHLIGKKKCLSSSEKYVSPALDKKSLHNKQQNSKSTRSQPYKKPVSDRKTKKKQVNSSVKIIHNQKIQTVKRPVRYQMSKNKHLSSSIKSIEKKSVHDKQPVKKPLQHQRGKRKCLSASEKFVSPAVDKKSLHDKQQNKKSTRFQPCKKLVSDIKTKKQVKSILWSKLKKSTQNQQIQTGKKPVQHRVTKGKQLSSSVKCIPSTKQKESVQNKRIQVKKPILHRMTEKKQLRSTVKSTLCTKGRKSPHGKQVLQAKKTVPKNARTKQIHQGRKPLEHTKQSLRSSTKTVKKVNVSP